MRKAFAVILLVVGAATVLAVSAFAHGGDEKNSFKATLNGYNEVVGGAGPASTGSVSTGARGTFRAKLRDDGTKLDFTLTYSGIEGGTVTPLGHRGGHRDAGPSSFRPEPRPRRDLRVLLRRAEARMS